MKSNIKVTLANRRLAQPHNAYNIYFILERYKLIYEMEWSCGTGAVQHHPQISYDLAGYDFLTLPDLPPPYQNLQLPLGWFVPGKNSKRKHRKTHGCELFDIDAAIFARSLLSALFCHFRPSRHHMTVTSFAELARTVAANWKSAATETKEYCVEVARILKKRHTELTKVGGLICLSPINSVSPGPTEEAKPRNFDNAYSIASATQNGAARPPHHAEGYDARAVIASATAGGGGGEIEINTRNLQADVSCAAAPRSPSLNPSIMAPNFSDDDEDIIGAWIWKSSRMARLASVDNTNGAS